MTDNVIIEYHENYTRIVAGTPVQTVARPVQVTYHRKSNLISYVYTARVVNSSPHEEVRP